jgi:rod shape determining protein RodA
MHILQKRYFYYFDFGSPFLAAFIGCIGLLFVWSATYTIQQPFSLFFKKQCLGIITGILIYAFFCIIDHRSCMRWGSLGYVGLIALLTITLFKGSIGMGAQRWINLGLIKFQPSELARILLPAFAAYHLQQAEGNEHPAFAYILFVLVVSFVLILKQPDLGTALIILCTGLLMCWLANIGKRFFIIAGLMCLIGIPVFSRGLRPYQKQRIAVFLGYGDTKKEGYQQDQAIIAIGSGGFYGKGLLQGTQNKLHFLPEGRTDFIFAVLCEEWGLWGTLLIILAYVALFIRLLSIVKQIKDETMQIFALGLIVHIMLSATINIGMVLGMLPIVGIPLPLMSYGISNAWITCASLGLFQNITMQRLYRVE